MVKDTFFLTMARYRDDGKDTVRVTSSNPGFLEAILDKLPGDCPGIINKGEDALYISVTPACGNVKKVMQAIMDVVG